MPGRRVPRQSAERAVSQHAYRAFAGALDGASSLPAPVLRGGSSDSARQKTPTVHFYQDRYTATGGAQQVPLTYLPLPYSEHVYLAPGSGGAGAYKREKLAWTRDAGKRDLQILTGMNARPGDTVVVEYAYYEQVAYVEPVEVPPAGTRYGPWITDAIHSGQLVQPKVLVSPGTYKYLGDGAASYSSFTGGVSYQETNNQDIQYSRTVANNIPPGWWPYSGLGWISDACTHHPVMNALGKFEPPLGVPATRMIGWDFGHVRYYDRNSCLYTFPGVQPVYFDWVSSGGEAAYKEYAANATVGPVLSTGGRMDVWYRRVFRGGNSAGYNPADYPNTVIVGTGDSYTVVDNSTTSTSAKFKDRVHLMSGMTGVVGTEITATEPLENITPYTGQKFTLNFLPNVVNLPGWGDCRVPAYRMKHVPATAYPPYTGFPEGWGVQALLDFKCYGTAQAPKHRMIYAL